jgi:hypothetical protein
MSCRVRTRFGRKAASPGAKAGFRGPLAVPQSCRTASGVSSSSHQAVTRSSVAGFDWRRPMTRPSLSSRNFCTVGEYATMTTASRFSTVEMMATGHAQIGSSPMWMHYGSNYLPRRHPLCHTRRRLATVLAYRPSSMIRRICATYASKRIAMYSSSVFCRRSAGLRVGNAKPMRWPCARMSS